MSIDNEQLRSVRDLLSVSGGDINTRTKEALISVITTSDDEALPGLWKTFLSEQGYSGDDIGTNLYEYLGSKGYTGDLGTRLLAAWTVDDVLSGSGGSFRITSASENRVTSAGDYRIAV